MVDEPPIKTLVLGSEGQLGEYVVKALHASGPTVAVYRYDIDRGKHFDLRKYQNQRLEDAIQWADFVYFLAFDVGGSSYLANRQFSYEYLDNNVKIMHNTFTELEESGTPFLFTSSQMSNMTESPYGTLKNLGEHYTKALGGINVRLWNVYGKETVAEKFHVITDFINSASEHGEIHMRTNGMEERQFLYGSNAAQALLTLAELHGHLNPQITFDVTSFEWVSILQIAGIIANLTPHEVTIIPGDISDHTQTLKNEPTPTILPFWEPTTSLTDGIRTLMP